MKNTLLDTKTVSLGELFSNGKIYHVPPYQRDYSWQKEHWEDLWLDILALLQGEEKCHYMGAIVLQAKDKKFLVIDGQQRFTTLSLLIIAIIKRLGELVEQGIDAENNQQRVEILRRTFLGDKDPTSLLYSSKLFLNKLNNSFYQSYILQLREPPNPTRLSGTDKLLHTAYNYFYEKIGTLDEVVGDGQKLTSFLTEEIAAKLLFIQISVEDELSAYTVFETLNARGLELTATDLLKNYLFSLIPEVDIPLVQEQWHRIANLVGTEKLPEFLRHVINSTQDLIRSQYLFKTVKNSVKNGTAALELLDHLEKEADIYSALNDPTHIFWQPNKNIRRYIKALKVFGVRQQIPLLLSAYRRFNLNDFERVVKLCVIISFRFNIVGDLNPNELEKVYNQAAVALNNGTITTPAELFKAVKAVYVSDEEFERDFTLKAFNSRRKKIIRYILYSLEKDLPGGVERDFEDDLGTIEHILPENPSSKWDDAFSPDIQNLFIYRLGNLTLLEKTLNREAQNKSFDEKKDLYNQSEYVLTQGIQVENWTSESLMRRQEQLAKKAVHIWRIDF